MGFWGGEGGWLTGYAMYAGFVGDYFVSGAFVGRYSCACLAERHSIAFCVCVGGEV